MTPLQHHEPATVLNRMRHFLLGLLVLGFIGTGTELLLINHLEDAQQLIPLVLLGLGLIVIGWHLVSRQRASLIALRLLMVLFLASGAVGTVLHYNGNVEFALELHPSLSGLELFWKALRGGFPMLGPAVMIELGLLGLTYTYRHPQLHQEQQ